MASSSVRALARNDRGRHVGGRRSHSWTRLDPKQGCDDGDNNNNTCGSAKRRRLDDSPALRLGLADLPAEMRAAIVLRLDRAPDYAACAAASPLFRNVCTPHAWIRQCAVVYANEPERVFGSDECVAVVRDVWTRWGTLCSARADAHGRRCLQRVLWDEELHCRCWEYVALKGALDRDRRSTVAFMCDVALDVHRLTGQERDGEAMTSTSDNHGDNNNNATIRQPHGGTRRPRHRSMVKSLANSALMSTKPGDGFYLLTILARVFECPFRAARYVRKRAVSAMLNAPVDAARAIVRAAPIEMREAILRGVVDDAVAFNRCDLALMAREEGADDPLPAILCQVVRDELMVDQFGEMWRRALAAGHSPETLWPGVVDAIRFRVFAYYPCALDGVLRERPPGADMSLFCAKAVRGGSPSSIETMRAFGVNDFDCPLVHEAIVDACRADRIDMVRCMVKGASNIDPRYLLARTCPQQSPQVAAFLAQHVADLNAQP
ncbi:hypothetical protein pkur_cds_870 [Pandoravirus kuranda]|uniref:Uncharacterized protein n=1 Tax=Pandoravirus kuranda TaxID=3019033 RepID=A0AA95J2K7_9VIRU|nr:hypothetical protein pkur_cds_870 [Pandoravirus kuranda]